MNYRSEDISWFNANVPDPAVAREIAAITYEYNEAASLTITPLELAMLSQWGDELEERRKRKAQAEWEQQQRSTRMWGFVFLLTFMAALAGLVALAAWIRRMM